MSVSLTELRLLKLGDCEQGSVCVFFVLESVVAILVGCCACWEVESVTGCDISQINHVEEKIHMEIRK